MGQAGGRHLDRVDQVQEDSALVIGGHILDVLHDEVGGGADAANGEEDVVVHEVCSQALDLLGEGGGEEESLALACPWHVLSFHNAPDLRFTKPFSVDLDTTRNLEAGAQYLLRGPTAEAAPSVLPGT